MPIFCRIFATCALVTLILLSKAEAQRKKNLKKECVNRLVEDCKKANYFVKGIGSTFTSYFDQTPKGKFVILNCHIDKSGAKCLMNRKAWFSCNANHKAYYKKKQLKKDSVKGIDFGICYTTKTLESDVLGNIFKLKIIQFDFEKMFEESNDDWEDEIGDLPGIEHFTNPFLKSRKQLGKKIDPFGLDFFFGR